MVESERKGLSRDFSGIDSERTIQSLRAENHQLSD